MGNSQNYQSILEELEKKGFELDRVDEAVLVDIMSSPGAASPHSCEIIRALESVLGRKLYE